MTATVGILAIAAFVAALALSGLVTVARNAGSQAHEAMGVLRDPSFSDAQKEVAARRAGGRMLVSAGAIALRLALLLTAAGAPIALAHLLGLVAGDEVVTWLGRPSVLVAATLIGTLGLVAVHRLRQLRQPRP